MLTMMPDNSLCAAGTAIRVAAIQMQADFAEVGLNLARAERLVREAFEKGAEWVILPAFFTTAIGVHSRMLGAARPLDGRPTQLLIGLAKQYNGIVGGSFIAIREGHAYNTFVLAFPDGSFFFHDKDYQKSHQRAQSVQRTTNQIQADAKGGDSVLSVQSGCYSFLLIEKMRV